MKKILLSLLIGFVGILSFCSAGTYTFEGSGTSLPGRFVPPQSFVSKNVSLSCTFTNTNVSCDGPIFKAKFSFLFFMNSSYTSTAWNDISDLYEINCSDNRSFTFTYNFSNFIPSQSYYTYYGFNSVYLSSTRNPDGNYIHYSCIFSGESIIDGTSAGGGTVSCPECPSCPGVNTGEILSGYILESEIDTNYCVSNNLCSENTGNSASWSELVINDIVHQSAPLININIPEEFDWNYSVDENEFALSVSGYNVDTDYIDGIITTQNAKPSTEDFNKIITELIPLFVPGLVIILFLRFIFKFIKKIF